MYICIYILPFLALCRWLEQVADDGASATEGPSWGYPMLVLGTVCSFSEPLCGHLSPKVDKIFQR